MLRILKIVLDFAVFIRHEMVQARKNQKNTHDKKLLTLSEEQQRPLFTVRNTVVAHNLNVEPPSYVLETLSLGPKNAVLDRFDAKDVMAELDGLLYFCKNNNVSEELTLEYIKRCKKMKTSRNLMLTKKFLKENSLLAVPFDKGVGICIMKSEDYKSKLEDILKLPQFEKLPKARKNGRNPALIEEDRVLEVLDTLRKNKKIDESLYNKIKPHGSQPARLYGLAKVHKTIIPTRPVLSMPGSAYYAIGNQVGEWLSEVPECQINTSNKQIVDTIKDIELDSSRQLVSFDVVSLYTNVPVLEAINCCADLLYNGRQKAPPVDKETFIELAKLASCNVIMSTHDGPYKQVDGLAMGSPPAPYLANGWLNQYDDTIKGDAQLYARYMDDVVRDIETEKREEKLEEINGLNEYLKFTMEVEVSGELPVLDLKLMNNAGKLTSTWYSKPTDTGLVMNYHALAPRRYKSQWLQVSYTESTDAVVIGNCSMKAWKKQKQYWNATNTLRLFMNQS